MSKIQVQDSLCFSSVFVLNQLLREISVSLAAKCFTISSPANFNKELLFFSQQYRCGLDRLTWNSDSGYNSLSVHHYQRHFHIVIWNIVNIRRYSGETWRSYISTKTLRTNEGGQGVPNTWLTFTSKAYEHTVSVHSLGSLRNILRLPNDCINVFKQALKDKNKDETPVSEFWLYDNPCRDWQSRPDEY